MAFLSLNDYLSWLKQFTNEFELPIPGLWLCPPTYKLQVTQGSWVWIYSLSTTPGLLTSEASRAEMQTSLCSPSLVTEGLHLPQRVPFVLNKSNGLASSLLKPQKSIADWVTKYRDGNGDVQESSPVGHLVGHSRNRSEEDQA